VRVLGIDPGTHITGWGILERRGGAVCHVTHGTVRTRADESRAAKLAAIHRALLDCCGRWTPDVVALEETFVGRNVQSAFRLGEVRGVAMLVAATAGATVAEYSPAEVKRAVTGTGSADKLQVGRAVTRELKIDGAVPTDAADALAVAMCHLYVTRR
jgi:crossover junction endodeoxyribonuclease RuvC